MARCFALALVLVVAAPSFAAELSLEMTALQKNRVQIWRLDFPAEKIEDKLEAWAQALEEAAPTLPPEEKALLTAERERLAYTKQWLEVSRSYAAAMSDLSAEAVERATKDLGSFDQAMQQYGAAHSGWFLGSGESQALNNAKFALKKLARFRAFFVKRLAAMQEIDARSKQLEDKLDDPAADAAELTTLVDEHKATCDKLNKAWADVGGSTSDLGKSVEERLKTPGACNNSALSRYTTTRRWYWPEVRVRLEATQENTLCISSGLDKPDSTCDRSTFRNQMVETGQLSARVLYQVAHPSRFVFLARDESTPKRKVKRGEAMLVYQVDNVHDTVALLTVDDQRLEVSPEAVSKTPIARAPLLNLKAADLDVYGQYRDGSSGLICSSADEAVADEPPGDLYLLKVMDPASAEYVKLSGALDKFWGCFDREMKKLDPDNRARNYDQETYNVRTGQTVKIEKYAAVLERRVCKTCGCLQMQKTRRELARAVCGPLRDAELARFQAVADRLKGRFAK